MAHVRHHSRRHSTHGRPLDGYSLTGHVPMINVTHFISASLRGPQFLQLDANPRKGHSTLCLLQIEPSKGPDKQSLLFMLLGDMGCLNLFW